MNASTGALASVYEYDPFGNYIRNEAFDSGVSDNPFRFSTKYVDHETHLIFYGRRYYEPTLGRFYGRDPKAEAGGLNLYAFVTNSPTNKWDYLGMDGHGIFVLPTMVINSGGTGGLSGWGGFGGWGSFGDGGGGPGGGDQASQSNSGGGELQTMIIAGEEYAYNPARGFWEKITPNTDVPLSPNLTNGIGPIYNANPLPTMVINAPRINPPVLIPPTLDPLSTTVTIGDIAGAAGLGALNFVIGGAEAINGMINGTINTILHPIDTVQQTADGIGGLFGLLSTAQGRNDIVGGVGNYIDHVINTPEGALEASRGVGGLTVGVLAGIVTGRPSPNRGLASNPFLGKSAEEINDLLIGRGFRPVGPDPVGGRGSYFHPRTGRKYYIDAGGEYSAGTELPHVDVHHIDEGVNLESWKKKYPAGQAEP